MSHPLTSRRYFLRTSSLGVASVPFWAFPIAACKKENLTIAQFIEHVISQIPGGKPEETVDTIKSGDPHWRLKGVATTFLATVDVIKKAAKQNVNLIVTHEPTFYNHLDDTDWLKDDPVFAYKMALLQKHKIVVWRFHDYWHRYRPDGILTGFLARMNWASSQMDISQENVCNIPIQHLSALATELQQKLGLKRACYIGDPDLECRRLGLLPGAWGREAQISLLQKDIEVLVVGEVSEWETAEYVRDASAAGLPKGLIILGHSESEEPGMAYCRDWLAGMFPREQLIHIPAGDPFVPLA